MPVRLNFINRSHDRCQTAIVLFQREVASELTPVAWKVIRHCGYACSHPFAFSTELELGIGDQYGNFSPRQAACPGDSFNVTHRSGRRQLLRDASDNGAAITLRNAMPCGAIDACLFNQGALLARRAGVPPGAQVAFAMAPALWIGAAAEAEEGRPLGPAMAQQSYTALSLLGMASADIVMTGAGGGADAVPLRFCLENIAMA